MTSKESKLAYLGHALVENRNGLIAAAMAIQADGYAERAAAPLMLDQRQKDNSRRITVAPTRPTTRKTSSPQHALSTSLRRRYVSERALVCLKLEAKGLGELPLNFRKKIFHLVLHHPEMKIVHPVEAVQVDVEQAHREVLERVSEIERAEQMVEINAEVMGGRPWSGGRAFQWLA
jgi:hypothetical protein